MDNGAAGGVVVTVALTEIVKRVPYIKDNDWTWPLLALVIGIAYGVGWGLLNAQELPQAIEAGFWTGFAAMGLYSGGKTVINAVVKGPPPKPDDRDIPL